jgi:hypothetical protein
VIGDICRDNPFPAAWTPLLAYVECAPPSSRPFFTFISATPLSRVTLCLVSFSVVYRCALSQQGFASPSSFEMAAGSGNIPVDTAFETDSKTDSDYDEQS